MGQLQEGGKPCPARGVCQRWGHAVPAFHGRSLFTLQDRECNQIMTRYSKLLSPVGKAGRQGAWKGETSRFPGHCLFAPSPATSVPKPFPSLSASPVLLSLSPSWALLPAPSQLQRRFRQSGGEQALGHPSR